MNLLAHSYLSYGNTPLLIGNFIADYVKGNRYLRYPQEIQQGILLHRKIDSYTDSHPSTLELKRYFSPSYRLHSGIVTDILYDHFLAVNWQKFHHDSLESFASSTYAYIGRHFLQLPFKVQQFYPFLVKSNWFLLYRDIQGIHRVLKGMSSHTSLPDYTDIAIEKIQHNFEEMEQYFFSFIWDLENHIKL